MLRELNVSSVENELPIPAYTAAKNALTTTTAASLEPSAEGAIPMGRSRALRHKNVAAAVEGVPPSARRRAPA